VARTVGFGPQVAAALDRYLRARRAHRLAATPALWLGEQGRQFGYQGLARALAHRAQAAGIEGFHPHRLRHTAASRWLARGGTEDGLMAMAGWTDRNMLRHYTQDTAERRAIEEAARLRLDDI
jgi:integrase